LQAVYGDKQRAVAMLPTHRMDIIFQGVDVVPQMEAAGEFLELLNVPLRYAPHTVD